MKKSIVYISMALLSFTNLALASVTETAPVTSIHSKYIGTPLCMAISKGDVEIVKKFIEYGADIHETSNGMTPLMYAARYNNVEILKLLVANGADIDKKDEKGNTALKYAEISKAKEAAAFLKDRK